MKNEKFMSSLSKEIKQKFAQARVEPLDDKLLEEVAGGGVRVPRSFFSDDPLGSSGDSSTVITPTITPIIK